MRTIHIAENFYDFVIELNPKAIKQIQKAIRLIKDDPTNPSLRRHKLNRVPSKGIVSYSPNQNIRIIAWEPENNTSYLLYVNNHDSAYTWAQTKKISFDSSTKCFSIFGSQNIEIDKTNTADKTRDSSNVDLNNFLNKRVKKFEPYFFDQLSDEELIKEGLPTNWINLARRIHSDEDLMNAIDHVPRTIGDKLFNLFEIIDSKNQPLKNKTTINEEPLPESINFQTISTDPQMDQWIEDLEKALKLPHEQWRVFLHPSQRKAVSANSKGPLRISGGAGTGKTVVGIHRAKHLAQMGAKKVHFITYNRTLMRNLLDIVKDVFGNNLGTLYNINTFHTFISDQLKINHLAVPSSHQNFKNFLKPGLSAVPPTEFSSVWSEDLLDLLQREIIQIIAAKNIKHIGDYIRAPRSGTNKALNIPQKETIWKVFDICWKVAKEDNTIPFDLISLYAIQQGLTLPEGEFLIVDEVQDLQAVDLHLLGKMAPKPNQLTLLEDTKQRIYGSGYSLKSLGINIIGRRSIQLFINYRTTAEIGKTAQKALTSRGYLATEFPRALRNGPDTIIKKMDTEEAEFNWVNEQIMECQRIGLKRIAILARTRSSLESIEPTLESNGLEYTKLDRNTSKENDQFIALCTMHSSKGLEFDAVFIIGMNYGLDGFRPPNSLNKNKLALKDYEAKEKHLFYVALSRARERLYITGSGEILKLVS